MAVEGEFAPSTRARARDDVEKILASGTTAVASTRGRLVVMMTMRGARSGKVRKVPVMRVEHGGTYAVVASQGGRPEHPSWYFNLVANPHVELLDGEVVDERIAREVHGEERDLWWRRALRAHPEYAEYQLRTARLIPVLILELAL